MGFGNHIDASGYILHGTVRLETDIIGKACLHFLGSHALRNFYQYMCTSTDGIFHQQNHPFSLCLQLQSFFQNLCRMPFLVEIQHQALERFDGIRNGAVVVLELGTVRSPDREFRFQLFIAVFYPPTTFDFPAAGEARDPLKVVCIGRIFPPKRVTEIIAAVSRARELSGKDLTLDIAGDLPPSAYSDSVRDLAARNGWISLKGPLYGEDKRRFLPTGTYAVHAQRDEAFGIAVTEYLKAGVVPIVPDAGGSREVVDNPALAYGSVEDAAQILSRLVCDASFRDEMVRHCRARAETFSRSAYRERQRRLLEEITTR